MSEPVVVAIISYIGVVTGVAGNWLVAICAGRRATAIGKHFPDDVERIEDRHGVGRRGDEELRGRRLGTTVDRLAFWRGGAIAALLFSLAEMAWIVMQPGEESRWFARMHIEQVVFAGLVCSATLILAGLGRPVKNVWLQGLLLFSVAAFAVAFGLLISDFARWRSLPPNEKLTQAGWYGFDHQEYDFAIAAADECVDRFGAAARRLESNLAGAPEPPTGRVPDDVRSAIIENGVLNDVATCYWIKGRAEQLRKDLGQSKLAYDSASVLKHARTWDADQRIFWSPAQDAEDRLVDMR